MTHTENQKITEEIKIAADKLKGIENFIPPPPTPIQDEPRPGSFSYLTIPAHESETDILIVLSGIAMAAGFVALGMAMR